MGSNEITHKGLHTMNNIITLTPSDSILAGSTAFKRKLNMIYNDIKNNSIKNKNCWDSIIELVSAEYAVAKFLNVFWDSNITPINTGYNIRQTCKNIWMLYSIQMRLNH